VDLLTSEIAKATGGALSGTDVEVSGATIDSRQVVPGQLFVPVVAARDGHDFVAAAVTGGATAYLTSRGPIEGVEAAAVEVGDTVEALAALGRHARTRLPERVVGITGSVGKTSVKDLLAVALAVRWRTSASVGSFNNELGVPLTLVNAADDTEALVVEMGARGVGHIAELCTQASPTVGVVTRVAAVHTETFGTREEVATPSSTPATRWWPPWRPAPRRRSSCSATAARCAPSRRPWTTSSGRPSAWCRPGAAPLSAWRCGAST
jgi:UDP-N-acetylmuramoyl-tripeptide--D-alanyl-D-alanine ligase